MKLLAYKLLVVMGLTLFLSSCSDFLEEDPKGKLATTTYFSNQAELDMSIHSLYKQAMLTSRVNGQLCIFWAADDIGTHHASNKQKYREFDQFSVPDDNGFCTDGWEVLWTLVKSSNYIINNAGKTPVSETELNRAIAQAYYWRAYAYFRLVRIWGPLPLMLQETIDYNATLTPVEDIYKLIVDDLKFAESNLPANWTGAPKSRNGFNVYVSQGAVKASLAYVYLCMAGWPLNQTDQYQLAAAKAKEVIEGVNSGTYNYSLLTNYSDIHSWNYNYKNPEVILGLFYNKDFGWEDNSMSPLCDIAGEANGWGDCCGEISFWKKFPEGPRKDATYAPKTYFAAQGTLINWWELPDGGDNAGKYVVNPYFGKSAEGPGKTEWDYKKGATGVDYLGEKAHQVIRLSEVYCWYAEAVGRSGGNDALAYEVLNKVRTRAGLGEIPSGSLSPSQLAEAAYDEHGWEIAGYYWGDFAPRYFDMQRMNRLKDHFEFRKSNPAIEVASGIFKKERVPMNGTWDEKTMMYTPYPAKDKAMNPNLVR